VTFCMDMLGLVDGGAPASDALSPSEDGTPLSDSAVRAIFRRQAPLALLDFFAFNEALQKLAIARYPLASADEAYEMLLISRPKPYIMAMRARSSQDVRASRMSRGWGAVHVAARSEGARRLEAPQALWAQEATFGVFEERSGNVRREDKSFLRDMSIQRSVSPVEPEADPLPVPRHSRVTQLKVAHMASNRDVVTPTASEVAHSNAIGAKLAAPLVRVLQAAIARSYLRTCFSVWRADSVAARAQREHMEHRLRTVRALVRHRTMRRALFGLWAFTRHRRMQRVEEARDGVAAELASLESELALERGQTRTALSEVESLGQQLDAANDHIETLKAQLHGHELLQTTLERANDEQSSLTVANRGLRARVAGLEQDLARMREELSFACSTSSTDTERLSRLELSLAESRSRQSQAEDRIDAAENRREVAESTLAELTSQHRELMRLSASRERELTGLVEELRRESDRLRGEASARREEEDEETRRRQQQIAALQESLETVEQERDKAVADAQQFETQLHEKLAEVTTRLDEVTGQLRDSEAEVARLTMSLSDRSQALERLESDVLTDKSDSEAEFQRRWQELSAVNAELNTVLEQVRAELTESQLAAADLQRRFDAAELEGRRKEEEYSGREGRLQDEMERLREEKADSDARRSELEERLGRYEQGSSEQEAVLRDLHDQIERLREEKADSDARRSELEERLGRYEQGSSGQEAVLRDLHDQIEGLREEKADSDARRSELEERLGRYEQGSSGQEAVLRDLHDQIERLREEKADSDARRSELEERLGRYEQGSGGQEAVLRDLHDQIEGLREEKADSDARRSELEERLGSCARDKTSAQQALLDQRKRVQQLEQQLMACGSPPQEGPSCVTLCMAAGLVLSWLLLLVLLVSTSGAVDQAAAGRWGDAVQAVLGIFSTHHPVSRNTGGTCVADSLLSSVQMRRATWNLPALPE
jgi:chromosome segregation ATPase